ncbi:MAG: DNA alkylation repair protein [Prevotella sp.]|nr:DNA alkylation repair protein [Prevotella sp.]
MTEETHQKLKEIKQSFRLLMNGEATRSMRDKGVDYHLNWGVNILDLRKMAEEYGKDYHLAIELWKENIRECKILATMIMPPEEIPLEIVDLWMEQTPSLEVAEQAAFNLYQYLDDASVLAFQWIASEKDLQQVCGFHVLSRLFMKGMEPNDRGINEVIDQAQTALLGDSLSVRHAAISCMQRFAELGESYEHVARSAMKSIDLDFI